MKDPKNLLLLIIEERSLLIGFSSLLIFKFSNQDIDPLEKYNWTIELYGLNANLMIYLTIDQATAY